MDKINETINNTAQVPSLDQVINLPVMQALQDALIAQKQQEALVNQPTMPAGNISIGGSNYPVPLASPEIIERNSELGGQQRYINNIMDTARYQANQNQQQADMAMGQKQADAERRASAWRAEQRYKGLSVDNPTDNYTGMPNASELASLKPSYEAINQPYKAAENMINMQIQGIKNEQLGRIQEKQAEKALKIQQLKSYSDVLSNMMKSNANLGKSENNLEGKKIAEENKTTRELGKQMVNNWSDSLNVKLNSGNPYLVSKPTSLFDALNNTDIKENAFNAVLDTSNSNSSILANQYLEKTGIKSDYDQLFSGLGSDKVYNSNQILGLTSNNQLKNSLPNLYNALNTYPQIRLKFANDLLKSGKIKFNNFNEKQKFFKDLLGTTSGSINNQ